MLSLYSVWSGWKSLVNTSQNSFWRPQTDFQEQVNAVSKELFDMWTGMTEKSQQIREYLSPFLKSKNIIVTPRNSYYGFLTKPKDYGRWGTARAFSINDQCVPCPDIDNGKCKGFKTKEEVNEEYYKNICEEEIDLIDDKRWAACLKHLTKKPTLSNPKMLQIDDGWRVAPRDVSVVAFDYYIFPREGTFAYNVVAGNPQTGAGDFIEYDALNSVKLQWPEIVLNYFLWKLAERYGVSIGNTFLAQFAKQNEAA